MEHYKSENMEEMEKKPLILDRDRRLLGLIPLFLLIVIIVLRISWTLYKSFGQKTRNQPQRRVYVGSRTRQSLGAQEPSIYVSPSNLPPPPKYECMAPPSYEEVVGVHYPNYQPITAPITTAIVNEQSTASSNNPAPVHNASVTITNETSTVPNVNESVQVTVTNEDRTTSVTVARS